MDGGCRRTKGSTRRGGQEGEKTGVALKERGCVKRAMRGLRRDSVGFTETESAALRGGGVSKRMARPAERIPDDVQGTNAAT